MRIYCVCGAGVGTSVILARNAENILSDLGIEADVSAVALPHLASQPPCQLVLATTDVATELAGMGSEIVALRSVLDLNELRTALIRALG